jgi:hypothetical protein
MNKKPASGGCITSAAPDSLPDRLLSASKAWLSSTVRDVSARWLRPSAPLRGSGRMGSVVVVWVVPWKLRVLDRERLLLP